MDKKKPEEAANAIIQNAAKDVVRVTSDSNQAVIDFSIYRKHGSKSSSKVLLVDDEREFIETLSERLEIRDIGAAVAFDAKSAMDLVVQDEPDVMVLDLNMPGINGMQMLQRTKRTRPNIEVIVLTGHGSKDDQELCMTMEAFAYLQKPVDIDELVAVIKKAHAKTNRLPQKTDPNIE